VNGHPEPEAEYGLKFTAHHDIRKAFQWIGYGLVITDDDLAWTNIYVVMGSPKPEVPEGMMAVDGMPELVDGIWWQRWDVVEAPPPPEPEDPPVDLEPEPETPADPPVDPEPDPAP
jgi:hypothetical protein